MALDCIFTQARRLLGPNEFWRYGPTRAFLSVKLIADRLRPHVPALEGKRYCDLGCGIYTPLSISTLMYLNGAESTIALDLNPAEPLRASEALLDLLKECWAAPGEARIWGVDEETFAGRLARFDLAALKRGDLRAAAGLPMEYVLADIHVAEGIDRPIDLMTSTAVLEHFLDFPRAVGRFFELTAPGGVAYHSIDLRDHRAYVDPARYHYWSMLAEPDDWSDGLVNRLRAGESRGLLEAAGFRVLAWDLHRDGQMPPGFRQTIRGQFDRMSDEDLEVTRVHCVLQRPA